MYFACKATWARTVHEATQACAAQIFSVYFPSCILPLSHPVVNMASNQTERLHKNPRKDSRYNAKEHEQMLPFKENFVKSMTPADRLLILRNQILPAMFNYWASVGKYPRDEQESRDWTRVNLQELTQWLSNNWRMEHGMARKSNHFRPSSQTVMWNNRNKEVMAEIANLMGIEEATTKTPGWLHLKSKAISNILDRMSFTEREKFDAEVEAAAHVGYPEERKRR